MIAEKKEGYLLLLGVFLLLFTITMDRNVNAEFIFAEKIVADEQACPVPLEVLNDTYDILRLINRDNLLEKDYPNQDIDMYKMVPVTVRKTNRDFTVRSIVNNALEELFAEAETEGIKLYVGSAYRTYRSQEVSHYNRVTKMGYDDGIVQIAGASEHQAGLAVDVVSTEYTDRFLQEFGGTKEGKWLEDNCDRFGFIIRYPVDKEDITKVKYEPWHLRYVGVEVATYIMESGLTFEEFIEEWQMEIVRN